MDHRLRHECMWFALMLALVAASCNRPHESGTTRTDELEGWTAGPSSEFVGDELFMLINGGAEIYHEYGFVSVDVQEYQRGEERYSVEVYTMTDDAFGIYSWARSDTGQPVDIGAGGTLADYYLHFWSGPHLVVVTAQHPGPDPRKAVLDLGRQVGMAFSNQGQLPSMLDLLPSAVCNPTAATYFVGPIAFNNLAPRLAPVFSGFEDGVIAQCQPSASDTEQLVFLRWIDPQHAAAAIEYAADRIAVAGDARFEVIDDQNFALYFDTGTVVVGYRPHSRFRAPVHILRITIAEGHRPKLDELPFWCQEPRRSE